ncbi:MAG: hypothetical protein M9953_04420 [Thermomicrobiales bacterium]|nr:hypothetical protein [Thermomicrobiales bacterium]MCO5227322.1 hypothetical protein [Thermomicrobiales bacterium]
MPSSVNLATLRPGFPTAMIPEVETERLGLDTILARQGLARHPHTADTPLAGIRTGSVQSFSIANGIEAAYATLLTWKANAPIIRLTPAAGVAASVTGNVTDVPLLNGFRLPIKVLLEQDPRSILILPTPEPISGRIATIQEVVRLSRHFALVVLDEQLAPFSLRRLTPLIEEWENIISIQRFPYVMPGETQPFAWMVHPVSMRPEIQEHLEPVPSATLEEVLRYGQIDTFRAERATARLKGQLFRELRKLSVVSVPYPSWGPALLARIERGDRDEIVAGLQQRGVEVYAPPHANLRQHFRATAVSGESIAALKQALIEINREL